MQTKLQGIICRFIIKRQSLIERKITADLMHIRYVIASMCATICKISHSCPVARADICLLMAKCHVTGVHLYIAYKL